jgi:ketosteroid isomerase-like protein
VKKLCLALVMVLATAAFGFSQTPVKSKEEQEVREMERRLSDALTRLDKTALLNIMADEYISTDSRSIVANKEEQINSFQLPAGVTLKSFDLEDVNVRIFEGITAVVTGRDTLRLNFKGQDVNLPFRYTRIYLKRQGKWQLIAQHVTEIPPPK